MRTKPKKQDPPRPKPKIRRPLPGTLPALLRSLSGFGYGTGGGTRVIRKPIREDE